MQKYARGEANKATPAERLQIHDGNALAALDSMIARGLLRSEAVKVLKAERKDIKSSRKALSKLNRDLNRAMAPTITKILGGK